jgi:hypothetical protein
MSAVLELVAAVPLEDLEARFGEDLAAMDEAAVGIIQASELSGEIGALDHLMQVEGRLEAMLDACASMEATISLLRQHEPYRA